MATAEKNVPATSTEELSPLLSSAAVVMIYLNGLLRADLPQGVEIVTEHRTPKPQTPNGASGRKIDDEKNVNLKTIISDLVENGFRPVRALAFQRQHGKYRAVMTFVHWKFQRPEDQVLSGFRKSGFARKLETELYDVRIFRNPGENGGNFIVDCGNSVLAEGPGDFSLGAEEGELVFYDNSPEE